MFQKHPGHRAICAFISAFRTASLQFDRFNLHGLPEARLCRVMLQAILGYQNWCLLFNACLQHYCIPAL